jgi:hypothetical protein
MFVDVWQPSGRKVFEMKTEKEMSFDEWVELGINKGFVQRVAREMYGQEE